MAKNGFYKYYESLPPWGKAVVVIGIGAGVYVAYKRFTDTAAKRKLSEEAKKTLKDVSGGIKDLENKGVKQSYPDAQYKIWADSAFSCYAGWGTCSGDTIFVNLKNDADVLKLIQAFGVRTIPSGKWNPLPDFTGNLPQVMRDELSASDIASINSLLSKKGITYKF